MPSWIRAKVYLVHTPDPSVAKSSILDFNSNNFDLSVSIKLVTKQKIKRDPKSRTLPNSGERAGEAVSGCVSQGAGPRLAQCRANMWCPSGTHFCSPAQTGTGLGSWAVVLQNGSVSLNSSNRNETWRENKWLEG